MKYAACVVPAAPVYKEATYKCEMINQLLFGETVEVLDETGKFWIRIKGVFDGYEGWVSRGQFEAIEKSLAMQRQVMTVKQPFTLLQVGNKSMMVPFGSSLTGLQLMSPFETKQAFGRSGEVMEWLFKRTEMREEGTATFKAQLGNFSYSYKIKNKTTPDLRALIGAWLDAPYLWGGRTIMGVDCSGFAQTINKVVGVRIARDAHEQALQGRLVNFLQEAEPGDLAFFDDEEGKIVHVEKGVCNDKKMEAIEDHLDEDK